MPYCLSVCLNVGEFTVGPIHVNGSGLSRLVDLLKLNFF